MRHLTVQQLSASLDGALVGVSLELVVRHLATCRECRDRHARLSKQDDTLRHLLAWDPGAEFFEDASIRLETILDAESRGVAPARTAEIESHLPRVTLDQVLRSANAATVSPAPPPAPRPAVPSAAGTNTPGLAFPDWMQRQVPADPVVAPPAPRQERPIPIPIEPVVLAQAPPTHKPEPVRAAAPAPQPEPVRAAPPVPRSAPIRPALRRAVPRWMAPLAVAAGVVALALTGLSALPPVIRIPAPELPRLPRFEWVRRPHSPGPPPSTVVAETSRENSSTVVAEVPRENSSTVVAEVPREHPSTVVAEAARENSSTVVAQPAQVPAARVLAPGTHVIASIPVAAAPVTHAPARTPAQTVIPTVAPPTHKSPPAPSAAPVVVASGPPEAETAADWPLLCGEVLDDTNTPVAGARVMLADLDLGARTDKRGRFCIAAPAGDRTLSVVASGFATARQVVSLGTQTMEVHVALRPMP